MAKTPPKKRVQHSTVGDAIVTVSRDNSKWISTLLSTLVLGGGMTVFHFNTTGKIDDGKDETRAHWKAQQSQQHSNDSLCSWRKDSGDRARDAVATILDDYHTRQLDTLISILKQKR